MVATLQSLHHEPKKIITQVKNWKMFKSSDKTAFEADKLQGILMSAAFNVTDSPVLCFPIFAYGVWKKEWVCDYFPV